MSDTPRTDATQYRWTRTLELARTLERELVTVTRELDEARALNASWAEKAATWMASPEVAQRLQGYRDLGQQVAKAQDERDALRAEVERLRGALGCYIGDGPHHLYAGHCPDAEMWDSRDPEFKACALLSAALQEPTP